MQARKADPIRDAAPAPRLTFGEGLVGSIAGRERRVIRYRVVRLLDSPDELRGTEIGYLDQGDEVQLLEKYGAYWLVVAPDGQQGWLHKMTLGEVYDTEGARARGAHRLDADRGRELDHGRGGHRQRCPGGLPGVASPQHVTGGLVAQHQDVLVDDVGHEGVRIAVRPQPRSGLVPDEIALGHQPDHRPRAPRGPSR